MTGTKERILDTALDLFNRQGERNVTTNHIAETLGISPGNLYYHFRNKAAIVSALFDRYRRQIWDWLPAPEGRLTWQDKMHYLQGILELMWQGRFLHRDLPHFLHQDPELRAHYAQFVHEGMERGLEIYRGLRASGLIEASDEDLRALMVNTWVLAASWPGVTHGLNPAAAEDEALDRTLLRQGVYQIICLEAPYLRGEALVHLDAMKAEFQSRETAENLLFAAPLTGLGDPTNS